MEALSTTMTSNFKLPEFLKMELRQFLSRVLVLWLTMIMERSAFDIGHEA